MNNGTPPFIARDVSLPLPLIRETWQEKLKALSRYLGPAFVVSVAYIDPGNFATNISGGSKFDYTLLWVILWSNLMAIFLQTLSAKLGIATGMDLATHCGRIFSKPVNTFLWLITLFAAIATYMAEFLGATLGFYLLFGIPLLVSGLITIGVTFLMVYLQRFGQQIVERVITVLIAVIGLSYFIEIFYAKPIWGEVVYHTLIPSLNSNSIMIAVGMLGATVMPHVIYLHSDLVRSRRTLNDLTANQKHFRLERLDIIIAMNIAFLVNAAMVIVSASVFYSKGMSIDSIEEAHRSLTPLLGSLSSGAFGLALLASGLSSSAVGAMAGDCMMKGFIGLDIPPNVRRMITVIPALILLALGFNPMTLLIMSQVVLSFALPSAVIPLLLITKRRDIMGEMVNRKVTNWFGAVVVSIIISLNMVLLYMTFTA